MNSNSTSRMPMLVGVGLALAALLLLLPAPVHADTLHTKDDTFVKEKKPDKNFGSKPKIKVKAGSDFWGFAIFDLSVLGAIGSEDVDLATLRLWIRKVKSEGDIEVCRVFTGNGPWTEDALTWTIAQTFDVSICKAPVGIAKTDKGTWVLVDITDWVEDWLEGADNHGIAILPVGTNIQLDSKENKGTSHPMEIEVTHDPSAVIDVAVNTPPSSGAHPHTDPCTTDDECIQHPHADVTVATGKHPHLDVTDGGGRLDDHPHGAVPLTSCWERIAGTTTATNTDTPKTATADCSTCTHVIGGGGVVANHDAGNIAIISSFPSDDDTWTVVAEEVDADATWDLTAHIICANMLKP